VVSSHCVLQITFQVAATTKKSAMALIKTAVTKRIEVARTSDKDSAIDRMTSVRSDEQGEATRIGTANKPKSVQFRRWVEIIGRITRVDELEDLEVTSRWYSDADYKRHRKRDKQLVNAFIAAAAAASAPAVDEDDEKRLVRPKGDPRGDDKSGHSCREEMLEEIYFLPNGSEAKERKRERIRVSILSVLLEQEQQWDQGENFPDPALLARVYEAMTKSSTDRARRNGELVAASLYDEEDQKVEQAALPKGITI